jgi:hypothetical protein
VAATARGLEEAGIFQSPGKEKNCAPDIKSDTRKSGVSLVLRAAKVWRRQYSGGTVPPVVCGGIARGLEEAGIFQSPARGLAEAGLFQSPECGKN